MKAFLLIKPGQLSINELSADFFEPRNIKIDPSAKQQVVAAQRVVQEYVKNHRIAYGINTGFGKLADKVISQEKLELLQRNLVLSHCVGTGALLSAPVVRLIMLLKINSLIQGYSGVRWEVIEMLQKMLNAGITPLIPSKGSVGASGDLAPLAHLAYALIGEGEVIFNHKKEKTSDALEYINVKPLTLQPKEGLALLNGTQVSTALLVEALIRTQRLFDAEMIAGALSLFATNANMSPLDPRIHRVRRMKAQSDVAATLRMLLKDTSFDHTKEHPQVQDPYSLRCQPQVMGACLAQLRYVAQYLKNEINAVTDNPLIFVNENEILSGGNFHAQWIALGADAMATVLATMANISERRIALLMDPHFSGLPAFLIKDSGENSGFMLAHVTAAALTSENKVLAHPASVDSIPTSGNQEDHVSMATFAARRLQEIIQNSATVVGIELLCAMQATDFRDPNKLSKPLKCIYNTIREVVPFYHSDNYLAADISHLQKMIEKGDFTLVDKNCFFLSI